MYNAFISANKLKQPIQYNVELLEIKPFLNCTNVTTIWVLALVNTFVCYLILLSAQLKGVIVIWTVNLFHSCNYADKAIIYTTWVSKIQCNAQKYSAQQYNIWIENCFTSTSWKIKCCLHINGKTNLII